MGLLQCGAKAGEAGGVAAVGDDDDHAPAFTTLQLLRSQQDAVIERGTRLRLELVDAAFETPELVGKVSEQLDALRELHDGQTVVWVGAFAQEIGREALGGIAFELEFDGGGETRVDEQDDGEGTVRATFKDADLLLLVAVDDAEVLDAQAADWGACVRVLHGSQHAH